MKYVFMMILIISSTRAFAQEDSFFIPVEIVSGSRDLATLSEGEDLRFTPNFLVGAGIKNNLLGMYGTAKVSILDYSENGEGIQFLAVGITTDFNDTGFVVAPITFYREHLALSIDIGNKATGISLGYNF